MKILWDEAKNNLLKKQRGVSFENFVTKIGEGGLLDDITHPNKKKYPNQKVFIVESDDYAYVIPYIENTEKDEIILKTAFPSRKMTKKYIGAK
jgi:putative transposon-encoded protein